MIRRDIILNIVIILVVFATPQLHLYAGQIVTYSRNFTNLTIPANTSKTAGWANDATIDIKDHLIIHDLDIRIDLTHTNIADLQISLKAPNGTNVDLCVNDPYNNYFEGANFIQTIFDDEAEQHIEEGLCPFTGRFKPIIGSRMDSFDNQDVYGTWRLRIYDMLWNNTGNLNSFEIMITIPEPAAALLLTFGVFLARQINRENTKKQ